MKEDPRGTYHGLENNKTYFVYVEQETEQLKRDQENMKRIGIVVVIVVVVNSLLVLINIITAIIVIIVWLLLLLNY